MWRRESWVLQVGRERLVLWQGKPGRLVCVAEQGLLCAGGAADPRALADALTSLWMPIAASLARTRRRPALTVMVESAWMPVVLLTTGTQLWRQAELLALARHRFQALYGPVSSRWHMQWDHMAGDAHALAFGLPQETLQLLQTSCTSHALNLTSVQPALAWGLNAVRTLMPRSSQSGWCLWPEQDRSLLALLEQGRVAGLHPALAPSLSEVAISDAVEVEALRQGLPYQALDTVAVRWDAGSFEDEAVESIRWVELSCANASGFVPSAGGDAA